MDKCQHVIRALQTLVDERVARDKKPQDQALQHKQLSEFDLIESRRTFEALSREFNNLMCQVEHAEIVPLLLGMACELVPADAYAVWWFSRHNRQWRIADSVGLSEAYKAAVIDARTTRHPVMPHEPVVAQHVNEQQILEERQRLYQAEGIESLLVMPLAVGGGNNATIAVYSRRPRKFNAREVEGLSLLSTLAAPIIDSRKVFAG